MLGHGQGMGILKIVFTLLVLARSTIAFGAPASTLSKHGKYAGFSPLLKISHSQAERNNCAVQIMTSKASNFDQTTTESTNFSWKSRTMDRLRKLSNFASILCVVDCTVLPLVTVGLPFLGLATSAASSAWLHELGHKVALWFVLPVGGLAMTINYLGHRQLKLTSLSILGLSLIYMANAGHHAPLICYLPHKLAHSLHCGTSLHRVTNLLGCAFLLSSNYLSHRASSHIHGPNCKHDNNRIVIFERQIPKKID